MGVLLLLCLTAVYAGKEKILKERFYEELRKEQEKSLREAEEAEEVHMDSSGSSAEENSPVSDQEDPEICVLLMNSGFESYDHEQVTIETDVPIHITGDLEMSCEPGDILDLSGLLSPGDQVIVSPETDKPDCAGGIRILSLERSQGTPSYEGKLTVTAVSQGYRIVNQVDLETYLKYVVPSEMPSGYPEEALKAQAVCARTYAVKQMQEGRISEYGAHVDDSVSFQVYNNIGRQESADAAVDATRGKIITYQGEPVQAYFFSTSCGFTSTDEVWDAQVESPYLRSVEVARADTDQGVMETIASGGGIASENDFRAYLSRVQEQDYEKNDVWYRWQITFPLETLQNALEKVSPESGALRSLKVQSRSQGGAVTCLEVTGDQGTFVIQGEYAVREFLSPGSIPILCNDGTESTDMSILPSAYFYLDPVYQENQLKGYFLQGGGYGHGVGMSQNGARSLAEDGKSWMEILEVFFQKIEISGE